MPIKYYSRRSLAFSNTLDSALTRSRLHLKASGFGLNSVLTLQRLSPNIVVSFPSLAVVATLLEVCSQCSGELGWRKKSSMLSSESCIDVTIRRNYSVGLSPNMHTQVGKQSVHISLSCSGVERGVVNAG